MPAHDPDNPNKAYVHIHRLAADRGIDLERLPAHTAIIMDGNGRWAQERGLPRLMGHRQGYKTLRKIVADCANLGIKALTVYGFSAENWRRPKEEVNGLMNLIESAMRREMSYLQKERVSVRVSGNISELPSRLQHALNDGIVKTQNGDRLILNLAINYSGRNEILNAVQHIARDVQEKKLEISAINENLFASKLYTAGLPDPDLLIRTSGEMRISNFLLWQIAYTELYVTNLYWPDFNTSELLNAIAEYQKRTRRFGGVK